MKLLRHFGSLLDGKNWITEIMTSFPKRPNRFPARTQSLLPKKTQSDPTCYLVYRQWTLPSGSPFTATALFWHSLKECILFSWTYLLTSNTARLEKVPVTFMFCCCHPSVQNKKLKRSHSLSQQLSCLWSYWTTAPTLYNHKMENLEAK